MLYGVLEISISLRQPEYFFKFTSGLLKSDMENKSNSMREMAVQCLCLRDASHMEQTDTPEGTRFSNRAHAHTRAQQTVFP